MPRVAAALACVLLAAMSLPGTLGAARAQVPPERVVDLDCKKGKAGPFPCERIDLKAFVPMAEHGGGRASDIVGWADSETKREYALMGTTHGVVFVDITKPTEPVYLGNLPKGDSTAIWQDLEVYNDHVFVVCDLSPCGLQIFDLTRLRGETVAQTWTPDLVYPVSAATHTLDLNPKTGIAYLNGSYLSGGSQIVDVTNPMVPTPAGLIADDGYTHDTHCRIYKGPDKKYSGKEICFSFNVEAITTYDLSDHLAPEQLSKVTYDNASYVHSGWLTEDHRYLLSTDEADETTFQLPSTTYIWDFKKLGKPKLIGTYFARTASIDHNIYIKGKIAYHASYTAGLRLLDTARVAKGKLREVAYFDVLPDSDAAGFDGSWAAYPFLPSGNVLISGMGQGLFLVRPQRL